MRGEGRRGNQRGATGCEDLAGLDRGTDSRVDDRGDEEGAAESPQGGEEDGLLESSFPCQ